MSLEPRGPGRAPSRNVFGGPLEACSMKPTTGFFRNGCCDTGPEDGGSHTVCIVVTEEFLQFSKRQGNDLSTPLPDFGFPGLKKGDRWWAPRVVLRATHEGALEFCALPDLKRHAIDLV
jgi:uncharacterized protein